MFTGSLLNSVQLVIVGKLEYINYNILNTYASLWSKSIFIDIWESLYAIYNIIAFYISPHSSEIQKLSRFNQSTWCTWLTSLLSLIRNQKYIFRAIELPSFVVYVQLLNFLFDLRLNRLAQSVLYSLIDVTWDWSRICISTLCRAIAIAFFCLLYILLLANSCTNNC